MKFKLACLFFFIVISLFISNNVFASEGTIELESLTEEPTRCFAASIRMQNSVYRIPFSCRHLIYPVDVTVFNYIMWATPENGENVIKLGAIGLGKGEFSTKTPFTSLFVTTENNRNTKTPMGDIVMSGDVEPIEFLMEEPTPTPLPLEDEEEEEEEEETDQMEGEEEEEAPQQMTTREKLVLALKRAGIAALFALVVIIGIVFVVSRSRG